MGRGGKFKSPKMNRIVMPKVQVKTIQNPLGGWGLDYSQSSSQAIVTGVDSQNRPKYSRSNGISFHRLGRIGHIAPGETFTSITDSGTRINELPLNGEVASTGKGFVVLRNNRLVRLDMTSVATDANYIPSPAAPNHAGHNLQTTENPDLMIVKNASGVEYVIWSWEDDTDADVAQIKPDGTSQKDDWFSTLTGSGVLSKGVPHRIAQGTVNNDIFILNGQYVAKASLNAGTGKTNALNLGDGWLGASIRTYGNYVEITAYRATTYTTAYAESQCRVFLWDGFAPNPNFEYDIDDNYASASYVDNGIMKVVSQGRNNTTKLKVFDKRFGAFYTPFESFQIGSAPRHGSIDMFQNMLHWAAPNSNSLYYVDGESFHYRAAVTNGSETVSDIGMVRNLSTNSLFLGVAAGGGYRIYRINYAGYQSNSQWISGLIDFGYRARILWFKVYFSQFGTGASAQLSFFSNYDTISIGGSADKLKARQFDYSTYGALNDYFFRYEIDNISSGYLVLTFNHASVSNTAAIVEKVEIGYIPIPNRF